jgi:hypothetical protein
MKSLRILFVFALFSLLIINARNVKAQCAVCTSNVETNAKNGGTTSTGLNKGIMYLLAAPYIAVAVVGYIWYKKYRRRNVELNMRDEKLHLN